MVLVCPGRLTTEQHTSLSSCFVQLFNVVKGHYHMFDNTSKVFPTRHGNLGKADSILKMIAIIKTKLLQVQGLIQKYLNYS